MRLKRFEFFFGVAGVGLGRCASKLQPLDPKPFINPKP